MHPTVRTRCHTRCRSCLLVRAARQSGIGTATFLVAGISLFGCQGPQPTVLVREAVAKMTAVSAFRVHDMPGLRGEGTAGQLEPVFRRLWQEKAVIPLHADSAGTRPLRDSARVDVYLIECGQTQRHDYVNAPAGSPIQKIIYEVRNAYRNRPRCVVTARLVVRSDPDGEPIYECTASADSEGLEGAAAKAFEQCIAPLRRVTPEKGTEHASS